MRMLGTLCFRFDTSRITTVCFLCYLAIDSSSCLVKHCNNKSLPHLFLLQWIALVILLHLGGTETSLFWNDSRSCHCQGSNTNNHQPTASNNNLWSHPRNIRLSSCHIFIFQRSQMISAVLRLILFWLVLAIPKILPTISSRKGVNNGRFYVRLAGWICLVLLPFPPTCLHSGKEKVPSPWSWGSNPTQCSQPSNSGTGSCNIRIIFVVWLNKKGQGWTKGRFVAFVMHLRSAGQQWCQASRIYQPRAGPPFCKFLSTARWLELETSEFFNLEKLTHRLGNHSCWCRKRTYRNSDSEDIGTLWDRPPFWYRLWKIIFQHPWVPLTAMLFCWDRLTSGRWWRSRSLRVPTPISAPTTQKSTGPCMYVDKCICSRFRVLPTP